MIAMSETHIDFKTHDIDVTSGINSSCYSRGLGLVVYFLYGGFFK